MIIIDVADGVGRDEPTVFMRASVPSPVEFLMTWVMVSHCFTLHSSMHSVPRPPFTWSRCAMPGAEYVEILLRVPMTASAIVMTLDLPVSGGEMPTRTGLTCAPATTRSLMQLIFVATSSE
jgi:hypothetical protein